MAAGLARRGVGHPGVRAALASAVLFGSATPAARALLGGGINPWVLAGLLYLGAGLGMALYAAGTRRRIGAAGWRDGVRLALVIALGGVAGPGLLMMGLQRTPASQASLLLTTEAVLTAGLAWACFREQLTGRLIAGLALICAGAVVLASAAGDSGASRGVGAGTLGMLAILLACACWAADNNLTRDLDRIDPLWLAGVKGLVAGPVNLAIGALSGAPRPPLTTALLAGVLGWACYGLSIALFVGAQRRLGTARTSAYFGLAPFVGAVLAVLLGERLSVPLALAGAMMASGAYLHLAEDHRHGHDHPQTAHTHDHRHDDGHHDHDHGDVSDRDGTGREERSDPDGTGLEERSDRDGSGRDDDLGHGGSPPPAAHTHAHQHVRISHTHRHYPDTHHRHPH